jgi:hypothetical protein
LAFILFGLFPSDQAAGASPSWHIFHSGKMVFPGFRLSAAPRHSPAFQPMRFRRNGYDVMIPDGSLGVAEQVSEE